MAKGRGKKKERAMSGAEPTAEQFNHGTFVQGGRWATSANDRMGLAYRRVPVIDTLLATRVIDMREHAALAYYRNQATQAEDDDKRENVLSPSRVMGGGSGSHMPPGMLCTPAILETGRIERELGSLRDIARAVAVDDLSLSQWCVERHGGRERYDEHGKFVAMVPVNKRHVEFARLELRMAARRIVR